MGQLCLLNIMLQWRIVCSDISLKKCSISALRSGYSFYWPAISIRAPVCSGRDLDLGRPWCHVTLVSLGGHLLSPQSPPPPTPPPLAPQCTLQVIGGVEYLSMIRLSYGMIWLKKPINILIFTKKYVFLSFGGVTRGQNCPKMPKNSF